MKIVKQTFYRAANFRVFGVLFILCAALPFSTQGNSYSVETLKVPDGDDIVGFTNGLMPPTGKRILKTKNEIVAFLSNSKNNNEPSQWNSIKYEQPDSFSKEDLHCNGVFIDRKGDFYFWFLHSPRILELATSDGRSAILELKSPQNPTAEKMSEESPERQKGSGP